MSWASVLSSTKKQKALGRYDKSQFTKWKKRALWLGQDSQMSHSLIREIANWRACEHKWVFLVNYRENLHKAHKVKRELELESLIINLILATVCSQQSYWRLGWLGHSKCRFYVAHSTTSYWSFFASPRYHRLVNSLLITWFHQLHTGVAVPS